MTENVQIDETAEHRRRTTRWSPSTPPSPTPPSPARRPPSVRAPPRRVPPPVVASRPSPACASCPAPASGPSTAAPSRATSPTRCTSRSSTSRSRCSSSTAAYDVLVRVHGGGPSGQAGAVRLGVARSLNGIDEELNRPALKKAGFLTRDAARPRAQEGRSQEGPQGAPVQQALIPAYRAAATAARGRLPAPKAAPVRRVPPSARCGSRFELGIHAKGTPMSRLFGTDGVRGLANGPIITAELALRVSVAAAHVLGRGGRLDRATGPRRSSAATRAPRASSSPRPSSPGWPSAGVDVYDAGVLPTPAVAYLTADAGADFGVMLSASHNPMPDNGIKFFARGGHKLPDEVEDRIEAADGRGLGSARRRRRRPRRDAWPTGHTRYIAHLLRGAAATGSTGSRSSSTAPTAPRARSSPEVFRARRRRGRRDRHRARRAQHQRRLRLDPPRPAARRRCVAHGADLGIAHDGDADRCLAVDATGTEVDGDQIMGILAAGHARSAARWPTTPSSPP